MDRVRKERSFPVRLSVGEGIFVADGRIMIWTGFEFKQLPGNWRTDLEAAIAMIEQRREGVGEEETHSSQEKGLP